MLFGRQNLIENGSKVIAPEAERALIETPEQYWGEFQQKRFHDYAHKPLKSSRVESRLIDGLARVTD